MEHRRNTMLNFIIKRENEKRLYASVLIVAIIFLVVILVIVLVAVPDLPKTVKKHQMCLQMQGEGSGLSCGSALDLLPKYLTQRFDNAYKKLQERKAEKKDEMSTELKHYLYKVFSATKPAARYSANIQAKVPEKQDSSENMVPVTIWNNGHDYDNKYGFQRFGVRYENGRIIVPLSGTYVVQSFLDLYEEMKSNETFPVKDGPIMHSIYMFNFTERTEKELITSCHLHQHSERRQFNIYSSCLTTLVDLSAGDEVRVKVNDLSLLRYPVFNSFGLYLI